LFSSYIQRAKGEIFDLQISVYPTACGNKMVSAGVLFIVACTPFAAAQTCPGRKERTSASNEKCSTDASSCTEAECYTSTDCCASSVKTCTADTYRDKTKNSAGATSSAFQTNCCTARATCSSATCPPGSKKRTGVDTTKCPSDAASCNAWTIILDFGLCCTVDVAQCFGNAQLCPSGKYNDPKKAAAAPSGAFETNCCTARATCSSAKCPPGYKKTGKDTTQCPSDAASCNACCTVDVAQCFGNVINCGSDKYKDPKKAKAAPTEFFANCCTAKATCSLAWSGSESDASVATRGTVAAAVVGAIIVAMATLM